MTPREYLQRLPHADPCPGLKCRCTRARTLDWVAALERVVAAYEARLNDRNSVHTADELHEANRALAELEAKP